MSEERRRRTIVIGHKNPDTDSICSAICYAALKSKITGKEYVAGRAGHVNEETQYVLNYFNVEAPQLVESVKTQVKDIEIRATKGVERNISLKKAWNLMQDAHVVTLPAVSEKGVLEGLITVGDITKSYMNVLDSSILSKAHTQYKNILETLEGAMVVGDENDYFDQGKVLIAAANPDMMEYYISEHDLVILGNRYESQLCAIEMEADCILLAKAIDGVYDSDPKVNPEAKKFDTISIQEVIDRQLAVVDLTASIMCMEHKMPMAVFSLNEPDGIANAMQGRINGTIVTA